MRAPKALRWVGREIREIFPAWAFFFLSFLLLAETLSAVLAEQGLRPSTPLRVFFGSLVAAKTLLVADHFRFVKRFDGRAVFLPVLWKSAIYLIVALSFWKLEEILEVSIGKGVGLGVAAREVSRTLGQPRFWLIALWGAVLITVFCAFRELIRAMGKNRFQQLFFGKRVSFGRKDAA